MMSSHGVLINPHDLLTEFAIGAVFEALLIPPFPAEFVRFQDVSELLQVLRKVMKRPAEEPVLERTLGVSRASLRDTK